MSLEGIRTMSREHLEDLVEYIVRQSVTSINVAPDRYDCGRKRAWVKGFDDSRARLIEMAKDHELLKDHLPEK